MPHHDQAIRSATESRGDSEKDLHDHFLNDDKLANLLATVQKNQKLDDATESALEDGIKEFKNLIGK